MKIALVQVASPDTETPAHRLERVRTLVADITEPVDLIVLPELWRVGFNHFDQYDAVAESLIPNELWNVSSQLLGPRTAEIFEQYAAAHPGPDRDLWIEILTDRVRVPSIHVAEAQLAGSEAPVLMYEVGFAYPAARGIYGALHGV